MMKKKKLIFFFFATTHTQSDLLDVYLFQKTVDTTVMAMTVSGFQRPDAGPNYTPSSNDRVYQFHIDNTGDAREDLTFQFVFGHKFFPSANGPGLHLNIGGIPVAIPLVTFGVVGFTSNPATMDQANLNNLEYYTVRVLSGDDYSGFLDDGPFVSEFSDASKTQFVKPLDFAGDKTFSGSQTGTAHYDDYVDHFTYLDVHVPHCNTPAKLFVGPRREPFSANLGGLFDLLGVEGGVTEEDIVAGGISNDIVQNPRFNSLECNSVVAFVVEIATSCLLAKPKPNVPQLHVLQAFASVRRLEHEGPNGAFHKAGEQLVRVGNPLANDLFIGLGQKETYVRSHPKNDAQFQAAFAFPRMAEAFATKLGTATQLLGLPRFDLLALFLFGVSGINAVPGKQVAADLLRLNTKVAPKAEADQATMALGDGDFAGFPNGRRFGDDVVDIVLRAIQGGACSSTQRAALCSGAAVDPAIDVAAFCAALTGSCHVGSPAFIEAIANQSYTDRSPISALGFLLHFPYINPPVPGNNFGDCWRGDGINAQFRTHTECDLDVKAAFEVRSGQRGCVDASTRPSCFCPEIVSPPSPTDFDPPLPPP
jgi:hypothetical protein